MSAAKISTEWELPDYVSRCEGCGLFIADEDVWGDHDKRGCAHRIPRHECEFPPDSCGVDACMCLLAPFCSEACANSWHGGSRR